MSFVAADWSDTDAAAHHGWKWLRLHTPSDAANLRAWQPWIQTTMHDGNRFFWWTDVVALWAEFMLFNEDLRPHSVVEGLPSAAAAATAMRTLLAKAPKYKETRAAGAHSAKVIARYLKADALPSITLDAAKLLRRPASAGCPAWQLHVTYDTLLETGVAAEAMSFIYFYDSTILQANGLLTLEELRRRAERTGAVPLITGWSPYPAPPPTPLPADNVDAATAAWACIDMLNHNEFGKAPYRISAAAGAPRAISRRAELEGLVTRPDGNNPEMRKRAQGSAPYTSLGRAYARAAGAPYRPRPLTHAIGTRVGALPLAAWPPCRAPDNPCVRRAPSGPPITARSAPRKGFS